MRKVVTRLAVISVALFSVPAAAAPEFMYFPVRGYGAYDRGILSSVLDHEVPHDLSDPFGQNGPYGLSGGILSFTGELFLPTSRFPVQSQGCYPKASNRNQSPNWESILQMLYTGTSVGDCRVNRALNYDNHPGYDYIIPEGKEVIPADSGHIISAKCINTFSATKTCEDFGAIAVDHGNGFVTQYLHMKRSSLNYGTASRGVNQKVSRSWVLGTVYKQGVKAVHLHVEVLQRKSRPLNTRSYYHRSNYLIVDPYGYTRRTYYADRLWSKPGCLWRSGCRY